MDGLVGLVAELERRLTGSSLSAPVSDQVARLIPEGSTYVLALFDGLGVAQLDHRAATALRPDHVHTIEAPFPTTTTVSLSSVATGMHPVSHGCIGHQMWVPDLGKVVNVLKWMTPFGQKIDTDTTDWLPPMNLWERLTSAGVEAVTVQPGDFAETPLTRALYRGARLEPVYTESERIEATVQLAASPGRLVFVYFAEVDVAAHVGGQGSEMYRQALTGVDRAWSILNERLPSNAVLVGTSDHGHVDYPEAGKLLIRDRKYDSLTFFGDPRSLMVKGEVDLAADLASEVGGRLVERPTIVDRLGAGSPHPQLTDRLPDAAIDAPEGVLLLPRGFDRRLTGYHGGLLPAEKDVPLLVGGSAAS